MNIFAPYSQYGKPPAFTRGDLGFESSTFNLAQGLRHGVLQFFRLEKVSFLALKLAYWWGLALLISALRLSLPRHQF